MKNEKYLVYKLKGKRIEAQIPKRLGDYSLKGIVNQVNRDVLNNRLLLTINERTYAFREPKHIQLDNDNLVLIYGDVTKHDISDDDLLEELRNGEHIDSILKKSITDEVYAVTFKMFENSAIPIKKRKNKK